MYPSLKQRASAVYSKVILAERQSSSLVKTARSCPLIGQSSELDSRVHSSQSDQYMSALFTKISYALDALISMTLQEPSGNVWRQDIRRFGRHANYISQPYVTETISAHIAVLCNTGSAVETSDWGSEPFFPDRC